MNYGLFIAGSGLSSSMYRMDVAAHNLANIETAGFKPQVAVQRQFEPFAGEDSRVRPSDRMMRRIGGGTHMLPNRTGFVQGPLQPGAGPLDAAIQGDGFFVVDPGPKSGREGATHLTRDGRFTRSPEGRLVQAATGFSVLDDSGRAIELPAGIEPVIHADGTVTQGTRRVGRIALMDTVQRWRLRPIGDGRLEADEETSKTLRRGSGMIRGGMVEQSAVDPIEAMMDVTDSARDAERAASLITSFDRVMDRAINGLGRVS